MFDTQMEMSFGRGSRVNGRVQARTNRAQWWFRRMRQIVDLATDWQPVPPPRPVQIWFPAAKSSRPVPVQHRNRRTRIEERQMCE